MPAALCRGVCTSVIAKLPTNRHSRGVCTSVITKLPTSRQSRGVCTGVITKLPTNRHSRGVCTSVITKLPANRHSNVHTVPPRGDIGDHMETVSPISIMLQEFQTYTCPESITIDKTGCTGFATHCFPVYVRQRMIHDYITANQQNNALPSNTCWAALCAPRGVPH